MAEALKTGGQDHMAENGEISRHNPEAKLSDSQAGRKGRKWEEDPWPLISLLM